MKQFFGAFFGSILGLLIATILAIFIVIAAVKSSFKDSLKDDDEQSLVLKDNSVLKISLHGALLDREVDNPFEALQNLGDMEEEGQGLNMLIKKIKQASADDKIKGIYLTLKHVDGGIANMTELRDALLEFKKSGKFIYSYAEYYGQKEYYLASAATKVFVNPQGDVDFKGLSMNLMFYKNAFEKLGVDVQVFRHGKYKSAVEPLLLDKMSAANRLQTEVFLNSIWSTLLDGISKERKVSVEDLNKWANNLEIESPEAAVGKLVDATAYEDEVTAEMKKKTGKGENDKLAVIDIAKYDVKGKTEGKSSKNKIAVIYASGSISSGQGSSDEIGSDRLVKAIRDARLDDKVKAIVLRVNSPGGSALASDVIWREVTLAKKSKPFIVSMGNLAASGGYYISCAADKIYAQPNTITGSIGVFGVIPNIQKALEQKLGITIDTVNTNKYSHTGSSLMSLSEKEHEFIQKSVENVYDVFTKRVAEGRKMAQAEVDSIGQGRVWTGSDALKIGLVDEMGGLNDALGWAAKKANVTDYKVVELPKQKHPFEELFGKAETEAETRILKKNLGETYNYLRHIQSIMSLKGIQARIPFELIIN